LVTLFANILQNPQDSRARSDLKLMNQVVAFLSILCTDDSNSSVRRMLSICAEFERISKVVLDKSDRESSSRRGKRKQQDPAAESTQTSPAAMMTPHMVTTPIPSQPGNIPNVFSPPSALMKNFNSYEQTSPGMNFISPRASASPMPASSPVAFNFSVPSASGMALNGSGMPSQSIENPGLDPFSTGGSYQHPFVPQDLWQMPMTLEWDWAEMTSGFGGMEGVVGAVGSMRSETSPMPQSNGHSGGGAGRP